MTVSLGSTDSEGLTQDNLELDSVSPCLSAYDCPQCLVKDCSLPVHNNLVSHYMSPRAE